MLVNISQNQASAPVVKMSLDTATGTPGMQYACKWWKIYCFPLSSSCRLRPRAAWTKHWQNSTLEARLFQRASFALVLWENLAFSAGGYSWQGLCRASASFLGNFFWSNVMYQANRWHNPRSIFRTFQYSYQPRVISVSVDSRYLKIANLDMPQHWHSVKVGTILLCNLPTFLQVVVIDIDRILQKSEIGHILGL